MSASLRASVKKAVLWRSGSQIVAQMVAWGSTLAVVRILDPADYGLFAMTQVVLAFLSFLNGYGFASSLIQDSEVDPYKVRQGFGLLLVVNAGLALIQLIIAPLAASWYHQPIIADLLRVQALIFLATPFIALPEVLLMRELDFRKPALVTLCATVVSATVALTCALLGLGVWTLVYAPIAFFWSRALGLVVAARFFVVPSFRFTGAGSMLSFGVLMLGSHCGWTIITQADVFIGSRSLPPRELGLYAEALFLTSLITYKFVPPLNEVAFPAYARIQHDKALLAASFLKAVRLIMLVTCPLYAGLAVVAPDAVSLVLGEKWAAMSPLVSILALAMPAMTLHILFAPAVNAAGKPGISLQASLFGAAIMPFAFAAGVRWGSTGLAVAWLVAFPLVPLFAFIRSRQVLGISARELVAAAMPGLASSIVMALPVRALSTILSDWQPWGRLMLQISAGGVVYAAVLFLVSRATLDELVLLLRRQEPQLEPAE
ncbi:MAG: lipopolysaccharide biosynthesis protein [Croceibacterium sp.]